MTTEISNAQPRQPEAKSPTGEQPSAAQANIGSSWGDRWKKTVFGTGVYGVVNYALNTIGSVALAYVFELKYDHKLKDAAATLGKRVARFTGGDAEQTGKNLYMGTKGLTLTMGGTGLLPFIKVSEDHRHAAEFKIGHALDVAQNALGMGNAATKENLAEYAVIKQAVASGKAPDVSAEDLARFKSQHHVGEDAKGNFAFAEKRLDWSKLLLARAAAWGAAFGTNSGLEHTIGLKSILEKGAPKATAAITKMIPAYSKLQKPDAFSKDLINDSILCVSASVTHVVTQKALQRDKHVPDDETQCAACEQPPSSWSTRNAVTAPASGHMARVEQNKQAANDPMLAQRA